MTVRELVELLKAQDQDDHVVLCVCGPTHEGLAIRGGLTAALFGDPVQARTGTYRGKRVLVVDGTWFGERAQ